MDPGIGLLTGAGISAGPPASIPLGQQLDEMLTKCLFEAATCIAPTAVDTRGLAAVSRRRRNFLARIARWAGSSVVPAFLRCFRVPIPNEAHLLAAAHAARDVLHVTLNFDDGIETAYGLLSGGAHLPTGTPEAFHQALAEWRRAVQPTAPMRVVASSLKDVDLAQRPLLIKLRGSMEEGWERTLLPLRAGTGVDAQRLSDDQIVALRAVLETRCCVIAGLSAADTDCRTTLLPLLRRGRFAWTSAELDDELVSSLRRIDPSQPTLRPSVEGLRSSFPGAATLPDWPQIPASSHGFDERFDRWRASIPLDVAAKTYAGLLSEAGFHEQASALTRALDALPAVARRPGG